MTWIELHTNLPRHPKTMQLQERLRMKAPTVIGHLCLLWMWALENAPDGRLSRMDAKGLAKICQIPARRAEEFLDALLACGFLDRDEQGLMIHDWESYGGRYAEKRRQNKERQKRYLDKRVNNAFITRLQDRTVQDRTEQDQTGQDPILSSGGGGDGAGGRAQSTAFLDSWGLRGSDYERSSPALRKSSDALADELFAVFCSRTPTTLDRVRVFTAMGGSAAPDEGWNDRAGLLRYAFRQAAQAGKPGVWPYIEGVLGKLHQRGIGDLDAAEDYDCERVLSL